MESHIKLGRIFGIEVGLHYTWFLIALLIVFSLAGRFQSLHPDWGQTMAWGMAGVTAALFFVSLIVHELSHAVVARWRGLPVHSVTLFALGGVARIEKEAEDPQTEFQVGVIGPITSAVLGLLFLALSVLSGWRILGEPETPLVAMFVWLGYINLLLAAFNMLPGFPMDGGRVLRAALWWRTGDLLRATRTAATVGQGIALLFIVLGIVGFFRGTGFGGLWIAFIGWFLLMAARASQTQSEVNERLRGIRVADVMARDCPLIDGRTNLQTFVDEFLLRGLGRYYMIVEEGRPVGLITAHEAKAVPRPRWPLTLVEEAMIPLEQLTVVSPEMPVSEALALLARANVNQLPVVADGRLEGILSRERVLQFLYLRAELEG
jgi:Zn-dependent protease/predicted transcriptional regulator